MPHIRAPYYTNSNGVKKGYYKWAPGVVRLFFNKELSDANNIFKVNEILKYLSEDSELANTYNSDLNGDSFTQLSAKITPLINKKESEDRERINNQVNIGKSEYKVVKIPDFETATEYAKYMDENDGWCVTHSEDMYDNYTQNGAGLFYFFLKNGFENIPEIKGENCPLDEYGLSMIAVSVTEEGKINTITCRWNHTNGGNDNVMSVDELQQITKLNPYKVCPPYTEEELEEKGIITPKRYLKKIANGARPEEVFKKYYIDGDNDDALYVEIDHDWYKYEKRLNNFSIESQYSIHALNPKNIIIPNSVTNISVYAFSDCKSLTSVTIPDSVRSIGNYAFDSCSSLASIAIPDSVTSIGNNAFNGVLNIIYYGIATGAPWGAKILNGYVDGYLLYSDDTKETLLACNNNAKGTISIPNSVTSIGDNAFEMCAGLTSIAIPNSVTNIGDNAFYGCGNLTSVTISNSVTSIGESAFEKCSSLTSITIPNSVTSIGNGAFMFCSNLTSVTIGNNVTSIGHSAFRYCNSITSITIPNSVTSIGNEAFNDCGCIESVTIGNNVKSIGNYAFRRCSSLTSVTIGNNVKSIGESAFIDCESLTSVIIPNSVTSIKNDAFWGCYNLYVVYIKNNNVEISKNAFMTRVQIIYPDDDNENVSASEENSNLDTEQINEVRERFNDLLKRMDGLFI